MARYTLVQPSDDYSFDAPDDTVATLVAVMLGDGVGWESTDGEERSFINLFITEDQIAERLGSPLFDVLTARMADLADALDTVEIQPDKRAAAGADPDEWHEKKRGSISDFRRDAREAAAAIRRKVERPHSPGDTDG